MVDMSEVVGQGAGGGDVEDVMLTLKCAGDDRIIHANLAVLVKHAKYFEGVTSFEDRKVTFDAKIVSFEALKLLIKFMDTGDLQATRDNAQSLIIAADYLQFEEALRKAVSFLYDDLSDAMKMDMESIPKHVLIAYMRIYGIVQRFEVRTNFEVVKVEVRTEKGTKLAVPVHLTFILAHHIKRIMSHWLFLELHSSLLRELLGSEYLCLSEEQVLHTITMWVNHNQKGRLVHMMDLLFCVRIDETMTRQLILDELVCACKASDCGCVSFPITATRLLSFLLQKLEGKKFGTVPPVEVTPRVKFTAVATQN